tara:strand:+ start:497 stop:706 length:210 start_codon:yes stop_codon:yes gene_type:complete
MGKCDKRKKMIQITAFIIEFLLLILAIDFVSKRNKKILSQQGLIELLGAFFCTPCYVAFAMMSKKPPKA